jgi:hypothetical protein
MRSLSIRATVIRLAVGLSVAALMQVPPSARLDAAAASIPGHPVTAMVADVHPRDTIPPGCVSGLTDRDGFWHELPCHEVDVAPQTV